MKLGVAKTSRLTPHVLDAYTRPFLAKQDRRVLLKTAADIKPRELVDLWHGLGELDGRFCIIYGAKDLLLGNVAREMRLFQNAHPNTPITCLENCGHFLQEDDPNTVAELIASFFQS